MDCVHLAFYKGKKKDNPHSRIFDNLICWWPPSRGDFSHSEVVVGRFNENLWLCWSSSLRDDGVRSVYLSLNDPRWVVVKLPGYPTAPARSFVEKHQGWHYDWLGILGFIIPVIKEAWERLFCSEVCALSVRAAALMAEASLPYPQSFISPSDLYDWAIKQPGAEIVQF